MPEWKITGLICGECYEKKLTDHYITSERRGLLKG